MKWILEWTLLPTWAFVKLLLVCMTWSNLKENLHLHEDQHCANVWQILNMNWLLTLFLIMYLMKFKKCDCEPDKVLSEQKQTVEHMWHRGPKPVACRFWLFYWIIFYTASASKYGILVLARSQRKPIFRIEVYRRIILQCNGSWIPYIDGLLPHMMFDESNYFSLQCKLEIDSN